MNKFNAITIIIIAAVASYIVKILISKVYLTLRYGRGYEKYYNNANITKFYLLDKELHRNNRIKMFVRIKDSWYEGSVIGLTEGNNIVIRSDEGDIISYKKDYLKQGEVVFLS